MGKKQIDRIKKIVYDHEIDHSIGFPKYRFKVYTDLTEINRISGHRFVKLVTDEMFNNDLAVLLQFLGAYPYIENEYMKCGKALEDPLIDFATNAYGFENVKTFSYEDLENGTDDFYFIRDMEYEWKNKQYTGEVKTFYNKKKVDMDKTIIPQPHFSWWLQLRLELEILKDVGDVGNIIFYYVDKPTKKAILNGRDYTIKHKHLFVSDDIVKVPNDEPEEMIIENTNGKFTTFGELMEYAKERRDELMTMYEDEEGTFYYAEVPTKYVFWKKFDHVKNDMDEIKDRIKFEEGVI